MARFQPGQQTTVRHGMCYSRTYKIWTRLKGCCVQPLNKAFHLYGGQLSERWMVFDAFFQDMGEAPPGKSILRLDSNEPFGLGNCIWSVVVTEHGHNFQHGLCRTRAWWCWIAMRTRCNNPKDKGFANYGGRGIQVCPEWNESFQRFLEDMGQPAEGMTLDRLDVNGNYEKRNCAWADWTAQANNRRSNKMLTLNGETKTVTQWARTFGISPECVAQRIKRGISPEVALSHPSDRSRKLLGQSGRAA